MEIPNLTVEGYRFCRSDGQPFDGSVETFVPMRPSFNQPPYAIITDAPLEEYITENDDDLFYHSCALSSPAASTETVPAASKRPFLLANRCEPSWTNLSAQQRDVISKIEERVNSSYQEGVFFCPVILEGIGGCGKTRLMAYAINHSPENTHVLYLTKQNKRLQDFLCDELAAGEEVPPRPVMDMSKSVWEDFRALRENADGRYACSVEKLVYHMGGYRSGSRDTGARDILQWELNIPDRLFNGADVKINKSNVVVFLDEYTMIPPPLLHKMLHCVYIMFDAPTVLIMGGDRCQLGPINWNKETDCRYSETCGVEAPVGASTRNNRYYSSDVRAELETRLGQKPFQYNMEGSQRSRDDPDLAKLVLYLRQACEKQSSSKAIERRLVAFGRLKGIKMFRYEATMTSCKAGLLTFRGDDIYYNKDFDDAADEDRHLGDDDSRDEMEETGGGESNMIVDWDAPPVVDMTPFISFYAGLYRKMYTTFRKKRPSCILKTMSDFVFDEASRFVRDSFPVFMVKKNDKCNLLSDTFLKTLYNGVYRKLVDECNIADASVGIEAFLQEMCVSMTVSTGDSPVQQTIMVGVPYRMTDTLRYEGSSVISNGELVLLTQIGFEGVGGQRRVSYAKVKILQQRSNGERALLIVPGVTRNRLSTGSGSSSSASSKGPTAYMFPMVPTICENIYQLQGNTIRSNCFVDLLSTKSSDMYVAISRFRETSSIRGIILSR